MTANLESLCAGCGKTPQTCSCIPPGPRLSLSPWKAEHSSTHQAYVVKDASGYDVAVMLTDYTTDWANAHLIAAAPDMLETLKAIQIRCACRELSTLDRDAQQLILYIIEQTSVAIRATKQVQS